MIEPRWPPTRQTRRPLCGATDGLSRIPSRAAREPGGECFVLSHDPLDDRPQVRVVADRYRRTASAVLARMQPAASLADTNQLIHALRLWGPDATFNDPEQMSGHEMLAFCLTMLAFGWPGPNAPLVQVSTARRVRSYRPGDRFARGASLHPTDLRPTLAERGAPADTPVAARGGSTSVRELLETALHNYHPDQFEYEWTAIAYARYLFPIDRWTNRYGQTIRLETLVERLLEEDVWRGVCGGTHRLEALVVLLRADEQAMALSPRLKHRIVTHLAEVSRQLVQSQDPAGCWNKSWHRADDAATPSTSTRAEQILVTGHHLEWLALAPPEVLPPRETLIRAGQWLVRAMQEVDDATLHVEYGPFSHAARALCLWRGLTAWQIWQTTSLETAKPS